MKIAPRAIDGFVKSPDPAVRVVLLFGPDLGMVSERARAIGKTVIDDLTDPFAVVELSESELKDDPARLGDEARAMSFGGGRRLIRIRGGGEPTAKALKTCLETPWEGSLIVIEAGELTPRSPLRVLCEKDKSCAAIGCYPDQGGNLAATVRTALTEAGVEADRDALDLLTRHLAEDRGVVRQEIEKLVLFIDGHGRLTVDDVTACLTDAAAVSLDRLALACGSGDTATVDELTRRALDEGMAEVVILRTLQSHFLRLEWVVAQGGDAASRLKPPVFFQFRDQFQAQARSWSLPAIRRVLATLNEAEIACKSTGEPAHLICSRALLAIASRAPGRGTQRGRRA